MKNVTKIIMVIIGTIIGAGFASGKEIYIFFGQYGKLGILGIIISTIITSLIIYKVLKIVNKEEINNYMDILKTVNPKYSRINTLVQIIVNCFLLISYFIMIAAFSSYMNQNFGLSKYISAIIFTLICYIVFEKNIKGIMKINSVLIPFLIFIIIFLAVKNIPNIVKTNMLAPIENNQKTFIISSILYVSYNSIILIPVLTCIKANKINKNQIQLISILSGLIIAILAFCIYELLLNIKISSVVEIPLLEITKQFGINYKYIYGFVIIVSIFTSAISAGYSFLENICKTEKRYHTNLIIMNVLGIIVSKIGFSNLVQNLYPIFGVLGILQILMLYLKKS